MGFCCDIKIPPCKCHRGRRRYSGGDRGISRVRTDGEARGIRQSAKQNVVPSYCARRRARSRDIFCMFPRTGMRRTLG